MTNKISKGAEISQEMVVLDDTTKQIVVEAENGSVATLTSLINSTTKEVSPETVKHLLTTKQGTLALVEAYKGNEDKVAYVLENMEKDLRRNSEGTTEEEIDDVRRFMDTILFELASIVKNSGSATNPKQKIASIKSTANSLARFLFSVLQNSTEEMRSVVMEHIGEDIFYVLISQTEITLKENDMLSLGEDDLFGDDSAFTVSPSAKNMLGEGISISFDDIEVSGRLADEVLLLLEILYENEDSLFQKIIENKVFEEKPNSEIFVAKEDPEIFDKARILREDSDFSGTVYLAVKGLVEDYERRYKKDKARHKITSDDLNLLSAPEKKKTKEAIKETVGEIKTNSEKIIKPETDDEYKII